MNEKNRIKILESYFKYNTPIQDQLNSFNDFVLNRINQILDEDGEINHTDENEIYKVIFTNPEVLSPKTIEEDRTLYDLYPNDARKRDLDYDGAVVCDIIEEVTNIKTGNIDRNINYKVNIGYIPIMLQSIKCNLQNKTKKQKSELGECIYDNGGYFIQKGHERVLVGQLRNNYNSIIVIEQKPIEKYRYIAEIRSMSENTGHSVLIQAKIDNTKKIVISLPYIKEDIQIGIVFKAFGYTEEEDIKKLINCQYNNKQINIIFNNIIKDSFFIKNQEEAIEYIAQFSIHNIVSKEKKINYSLQVLEMEIFPHMGINSTKKEKCIFIGIIINNLINTYCGIRLADDRDNYDNKRVEISGTLCYTLFRTLFKKYKSNLILNIKERKRRLNILLFSSKIKLITNGFKSSFATGNWGFQKNSTYIRSGVSQILSRLSAGATLSHLRRYIIPIGKKGKNHKIRQIHSSQFGYICPCESPEGQTSGLVLNFSVLTKITTNISTTFVKDIICSLENLIPVEDINISELNDYTKLFLNGLLLGFTKETYNFLDNLKSLRTNKHIDSQVSISYNIIDNIIKVYSDEGRFSRPLFVVENGNVNIKDDMSDWKELVDNNIIQYVDASEIENNVVAMTPKFLTKQVNDFCEIHPQTLLGIMASTIPFPDHSQCIYEKEPVYMKDGSVKCIRDVKVGDEVITFDPSNQKQTIAKVTYTCTKPTDKNIHTIETISGRKIIATFDHKFMTKAGWLRLEDINIFNDKKEDSKSLIAISLEPLPVSTEVEEYIVLDNQKFNDNLKLLGIKESCIKKYSNDLKHLFPIKSNDNNLIILSRIFGFCLTDSWIGISDNGIPRLAADFGSEYSSELFNLDINRLGIKSVKTNYKEKENFGATYRLEYCGILPSLLLSLGSMHGKKTCKEFITIPNWILNGSDMIKREFLAGFQGGDGSKIKYCDTNQLHIHIGETSRSVKKQYQESLILFMKNIVDLFRYFDIDVSDIKQKQCKYDDDIIIYSYLISSNRLNLIRYYDIIGYRYDVYKHVESGILVEYLKYINIIHQNKIKLVEYIKKLRNNNTPTQISSLLKIPIKTVYNSLKLSGKTIGMPKMGSYIHIKEWNKIISYDSTTLYVPVVSKHLTKNVMISDITIDSPNQSFICGDRFCVHNSPRNIYQCLSPDTNVLMSDGTQKQIKDVKVNDEVITFCPKTMVTTTTKVIHQYTRPTENKIYKITTISGREIIATGNHNFMTQNGWIPVEKMLIEETKIGICLQPNHMSNIVNERKIILSTDDIFKTLSQTKMNKSLITKHIKDLEKIGLIPLYNDSKKLEIISRIYGFTCTDGRRINIYNKKHGHYTPQCQYDFGTQLDCQTFENDIKSLGFKESKIKEHFSQFDGSTYHTWCCSHNGSLPSLLISLGISYGRKTETYRNKIPQWIMNGTDSVKREFISGFQGGDGCQIRWNRLKGRKSYNFVCDMTSQQINPLYKDSLELFFNQCVEILNYFDIETTSSSKTIEHNRIQYSFKISDKQENLIKYYDTIGYRYAYYKIVNGGKLIEYLKYKKMIVDKHIKLIQNIRNDCDIGLDNRQIADKYNIKIFYKNNRKISSPDLYNNNVEDWINIIEDKSTSIFVPIKSIEELPNQLISDITVDSENHSFIAGDNFLSSNSSMGKQAIGIPLLSYNSRFDTILHVLDYPQKPLVSTKLADLLGINKTPSGINAIVAIACYTGQNQEDSIIMNKSSIDRGLFVATSYRTLTETEKKRETYEYEIIKIPPENSSSDIKEDDEKFFRRTGDNYSYLNENGIIRSGISVKKGDVIVGKITIKNNKKNVIKTIDCSRVIACGEEGIIDRVEANITPNGYKIVKIVIRKHKIPEVGDKFAARSAQKGTIGAVYNQEDMPFTDSGIIPDIIMNPHAIPSRMTVNQLMECVLGKKGCFTGEYGDASPFTSSSIDVSEQICTGLEKFGYERHGWETMYNGMTGEPIKAKIFIGPTYYQRLKHIVSDKIHARARGHVTTLCRQPLEGFICRQPLYLMVNIYFKNDFNFSVLIILIKWN